MSQSMSDSETAAYMAPEVIESDHFNTKADVYTFGILMYEVLSGRRAYDDLLHGRKRMNQFQLKLKVKEGMRPKFDFPIKKGLKKMIEKCWSANPKERPSFNELFKKLSLSSEDYFLEFECNHEEPKISDEEEEDGDVEDEDFDSGFVLSKRFCLENVDTNELLEYVDEIKETETKTKNSDKEIEELKGKVKRIEAELDNVKKEKDDEIASLRSELEKVKREKSAQNFGRFFSVELSLTSPGILCQLRNRQKSPFDRLFVISQSSADIYTLLVPDANDMFATTNDGNFMIEFELETAVNINGVRVFSSLYFLPKSFDISVDGKTVKSIKEATELNGKYKDMIINFSPVVGRKIRFTQTGPNWDKDNNFLYIKGIELLSSESKYSGGVFKTLVESNPDKDPHKCPVIITSTYFDNNNIQLIDNNHILCTFADEGSWFQVELTRGSAILNGFRLNRTDPNKLRSYKIICTDDSSKPESSWTTLIEIDEKTENEHEQLDIYEFPNPSPLTRFVRLVSTGKTWSDNFEFKVLHFDLFGSYF